MEVENIIEAADKRPVGHRKILPEESQRMPTDLTESQTYFSIRQKYAPDDELMTQNSLAKFRDKNYSMQQLETLQEQQGSTEIVTAESNRDFRIEKKHKKLASMNLNADIISEHPRHSENPPTRRLPKPQYKALHHLKEQKRLKEKVTKQLGLLRKPDDILTDLNKALDKIHGISEIRKRAYKTNSLLSLGKKNTEKKTTFPKIGRRNNSVPDLAFEGSPTQPQPLTNISKYYGSVESLRREISYVEKEQLKSKFGTRSALSPEDTQRDLVNEEGVMDKLKIQKYTSVLRNLPQTVGELKNFQFDSRQQEKLLRKIDELATVASNDLSFKFMKETERARSVKFDANLNDLEQCEYSIRKLSKVANTVESPRLLQISPEERTAIIIENINFRHIVENSKKTTQAMIESNGLSDPFGLPLNRVDAIQLQKWFEAILDQLNKGQGLTEGERFLLIQRVYMIALSELSRQVSVSCRERGEVFVFIWNSYLTLFSHFLKSCQEETMRFREHCQSIIEEVKNAAHECAKHMRREYQKNEKVNQYLTKELFETTKEMYDFQNKYEQIVYKFKVLRRHYTTNKTKEKTMNQELQALRLELRKHISDEEFLKNFEESDIEDKQKILNEESSDSEKPEKGPEYSFDQGPSMDSLPGDLSPMRPCDKRNNMEGFKQYLQSIEKAPLERAVQATVCAEDKLLGGETQVLNRTKHRGCQCGEKGIAISTQTEKRQRNFTTQTSELILSLNDEEAQIRQRRLAFYVKWQKEIEPEFMKLLEERNQLRKIVNTLGQRKKDEEYIKESLRSKVEQGKMKLQEMWAKEQTLNEKIEELNHINTQTSQRNQELEELLKVSTVSSARKRVIELHTQEDTGKIREIDQNERDSDESVESIEHFERVRHISHRNPHFGFKSSPDPVQRHTSTTESDIVTLSPVHYKRELTLKEGKRKKTGSYRLKKRSCKTPSRKTDPETCSVSEASFEGTLPPRRIQTGFIESRIELKRMGQLISRSESPKKQIKRDFPADLREVSQGRRIEPYISKAGNLMEKVVEVRMGSKRIKYNVKEHSKRAWEIISKVQKLPINKLKTTLPMRALLREIDAIYLDIIKQGSGALKKLNLVDFLFMSCLNRFGLIQVAERKLKQILESARKHSNINHRIKIFAGFLQLLTDQGVFQTKSEFVIYIDMREFILAHKPNPYSSYESAADLIDFKTLLESISHFFDGKIKDHDLSDLLKFCSTNRIPRPNMNDETEGIIDYDKFAELAIKKYKKILHEEEDMLADCYEAIDFSTSGFISVREIILLYRHIMLGGSLFAARQDVERLKRQFQNYSDLLLRSDSLDSGETESPKEQLLSKKSFIQMCKDKGLFTYQEVLTFISRLCTDEDQEYYKIKSKLRLEFELIEEKLKGAGVYDKNWGGLIQLVKTKFKKDDQSISNRAKILSFFLLSEESRILWISSSQNILYPYEFNKSFNQIEIPEMVQTILQQEKRKDGNIQKTLIINSIQKEEIKEKPSKKQSMVQVSTDLAIVNSSMTADRPRRLIVNTRTNQPINVITGPDKQRTVSKNNSSHSSHDKSLI